jgi:plasmid stabilization system protein ParE
MPKTAWSAKRERQYEHIKSSLQERGRSEDLAEEIAARTVNKERAQHGEAENPNPATLRDMSAPRRGGLRSHKGAGGRTRDQLYEEARARNVAGRSRMSKAQLQKALQR